MLSEKAESNIKLIALGTLGVAAMAIVIGSAAIGQGDSKRSDNTIPREDTSACLACHSGEVGGHKGVNAQALAQSPHKELKCQDCHSTITSAPHTAAMMKEKPACGNCHPGVLEAFNKSAHAHKDQVSGDHPTCITCHGNGDPHAISADRLWPRAKKAGLCSTCHRQKERMAKYGVDPDAVPSYEESFHGKALQRFGNLKVAICVDCHGHHDVLAPSNAAAPTNRANAAKTCSQAGCHVGAKVNFAMSGANHLRLKVKESALLMGELTFFRILIFGMMALLVGLVFLDLKKKIFHKGPPPRCGRTVSFVISLAFLNLVATIILGTLGFGAARWTWIATLSLIALAYLAYVARREAMGPAKHHTERMYPHMCLVLRIQHGLLAVCITLLMATGLPLRFATSPTLRSLHSVFGGLDGARIVHRSAAVVLIITWVWHAGWLLMRWYRAGFSFKSWTMWPTRQDLRDFWQQSLVYFGRSEQEPKFGRYSFRSKLDYLAEYWGMPVMVLSGLVLWFPIYFGNRLPETGISFALIAHGYEATLAFIAIVSWHMYNAHFNPDVFPMNPVFLTGTMPESEMEREHPLELHTLTGVAATVAAIPHRGGLISGNGDRPMAPFPNSNGGDTAPPDEEHHDESDTGTTSAVGA